MKITVDGVHIYETKQVAESYLFTKEVSHQIAEDLVEWENNHDSYDLYWDGERGAFVAISCEYPHDETVFSPSPDGLYEIGAGIWAWHKA